MNKCRLASELSDEYAHMTAFPEDDTVDIDDKDESENSIDEPNQANLDAARDVTDTSQSMSGSKASNPTLRDQHYNKNRYNLRKR